VSFKELVKIRLESDRRLSARVQRAREHEGELATTGGWGVN
jgi:hypothetical protein